MLDKETCTFYIHVFTDSGKSMFKSFFFFITYDKINRQKVEFYEWMAEACSGVAESSEGSRQRSSFPLYRLRRLQLCSQLKHLSPLSRCVCVRVRGV